MDKLNLMPDGTWIKLVKRKRDKEKQFDNLIGLIAEYDDSEEYKAYSIYFFTEQGDFMFRYMISYKDSFEIIKTPGFAKEFKIAKLPEVYLDVVEEIGLIDAKNGHFYIGSQTMKVKNSIKEMDQMKKRLLNYLK